MSKKKNKSKHIEETVEEATAIDNREENEEVVKKDKLDLNKEVKYLKGVRDRYVEINKDMPSEENENTIRHLNIAIHHQNALKEKRKVAFGKKK